MAMILFAFVALFLSRHGVAALNSTSWARCRVYPDPHFRTWHGDTYDYHGGCDLVLISNPMLQLHIRTKKFGGWSGIEAAAIQMGGDKLEVKIPGWIFLNNVNVTDSPPATVGGYPFSVVAGTNQKYELNFTGGQYIHFRRSYGSTLQVDVLGHGSDFSFSEGLCGNWTSETPKALVGRDHVSVYPLMPVQNAYGEEWQVNTTIGDPMLFKTSASAKCTNNSTGVCMAGALECQNQVTAANNACINVTQAENAQANCIFDVLTTGDVDAATTDAYTDPIIGNPPEKNCVERRNITDAIGCKGRGGQCVWRCDRTTHICMDQFCQGNANTEGCSCALPLTYGKTPAPARAPVLVMPIVRLCPDRIIGRRDDGTLILAAKCTEMGGQCVQRCDNTTHICSVFNCFSENEGCACALPMLRAPTKAPVNIKITDAPRMVPVNVNITNAPITSAPTKAPVKVNITTAPTKAPVHGVCLNSTSWARCSVYPDPHFRTWHGDAYNYHGGCDLVLITNPLLDLHIRTKKFGGWSGIEAAAIRIGGDILEVTSQGTIYLNGPLVTDPLPIMVGQQYQFSMLPGLPLRYRLNMAGGQYIQFKSGYQNTLQVDVLGHGSDFGGSEGLCANWTAASPNALIDRDHYTMYPLLPVQNAYGEEWQVQTDAGDPLLFRTAGSAQCTYNPTGACTAGAPACENQVITANNACANVTTVGNAQANCVFDVITTGDVDAATTDAYTNPILGNPTDVCNEENTITGINACKEKGGQCVWRCDNKTHSCVDNLCQGPIEGCSCALPMNLAPTKAPVEVNTPTKAPVRLTDTSVTLNSTSWAYCQVYPDPHFRTWHGDFYDYHGGCDLVLITNPLLDLHIRTKTFGGFSGIESLAIQIGMDKLEVQLPGTVYLNGGPATNLLPVTVGPDLYQFSAIIGAQGNYRLDMAGGQYIKIESYGFSLAVTVLGHGSDFGRSEGLCANWTATSPNALIDRDHSTISPLLPIQGNGQRVQNAYGEEWQVQPSDGPTLFKTAPPAQCTYNPTGVCTAGAPACQNLVIAANDACAGVTTVGNAQANCVFDVLTTGDVAAATINAYTNPILGNPSEVCVEKENIADAIGCKGRGGQCVWRCDNTTHTCVDKFCQGPFEGCSCALPKTRAPTKAPIKPITNPTRVPTKAPIKPAITNPTRVPTKAPIKPAITNPTRFPTKAPIKPAPVPIKPTKAPTKSPTSRQPTGAPTKKPCGPFGWNILCRCGFLGRLLGLC